MLGQITDSFNGTFTTNCGTWTPSFAMVGVYIHVVVTDDMDGDGIPDESDSCVESGIAFQSNPQTDLDSDGCHDLTEDEDDDADGIRDGADRCARGLLGWDAQDELLDWDSDGCRDDSEDEDDDDDTVPDSRDSCPKGTQGWTSTSYSDHDGDGCRDYDNDDDDDNDSILDGDDSCPIGLTAWIPTNATDYDSDGCRDIDEDGDDDADGVIDFDDQCQYTMLGATVNEYGCAPWEWDDDGDGVMDDADLCPGTPDGLVVNAQGCADLDGDGVFANVDSCPDSPPHWTSDVNGCSIIQRPVDWDSTGPYSIERFGTVGPMTIQTRDTGTWRIADEWDGESTYLFIFLQKQNSYISSLWNQDVGRLLDATPQEAHIFFGSYDSDWANDVNGMESRVNSYYNNQQQDKQDWIDSNIHFVNQQAWYVQGSLNDVINDWSKFYYGIDRFQQWREIGSLSNWAGTFGVNYRFDYIAKEPQMWNKEFLVESRGNDPAVTVVDVWDGERHNGGWGGGHSSYNNGTFPNASTMLTFNTIEVYMHHACSEHRDRYGIDDDGDGSTDRYGGCHEWDYDQRLNICTEAGNHSTCGTEFVRYITTYGREGRWLTDVSPYLFMLLGGGQTEFRYSGANGGWFNISIYLSTWDDDGLRATDAEWAFGGGSFRGEYNNDSRYKRFHDLNLTSDVEKVTLTASITGHGFGKDNANCAEFCNHEHRYMMNGYDVQEDHPMAGNSTHNSDNEGCAKETDVGTVANQMGSWPYGRAGWCAGQDVKQWNWDITDWVDFSGGPNTLQYAGLYDGQNYIPQNEQSGANQDIRVTSYVVYWSNVSTGNPAPNSVDEPGEPLPTCSSQGGITAPAEQSPVGTIVASENKAATSEEDSAD